MDSKKKRTMSRREFMKASTAAAAATAVGGSWLGMLPKKTWADKKSNSIIIGWGQEMSQFNPILIGDTNRGGLPMSCMFDALWDPRPDGTWSPNLAVRVPTIENGGVSKDGLTWKIELRKGVKWQDGAPFTAADVEFTYQQITNPKVNVANRVGFNKIKQFKVIDDYHIEFTMNEPFGPMHLVWDMKMIIPKHALANVADMNTCAWNTTDTFGTGPLKLVERVVGSHLMFKRNPNYHFGPPKIETVIVKFIPDQLVLYTNMKTGEIDFLGLPGMPKERVEDAKRQPDWDIVPRFRASTECLLMNCHRPYFQDKRVRQALSMAIDRHKIVKDVCYDIPQVTYSYINSSNWAFDRTVKNPYDPKKAADLLDALGWRIGSDGIRAKDGLKLAFTLTTDAGNKEREKTQLLVQKMFKDIGVSAELKNLNPAVMWGAFFEETQYDMVVINSGPDLGPDPDYSATSHSKRPRYLFWSGTPEWDKLLEEGVRTVDRAKRMEIYARLQRMYFEESFAIALYGLVDVIAKKKPLAGYVDNPKTNNLARFIREWHWT